MSRRSFWSVCTAYLGALAVAGGPADTERPTVVSLDSPPREVADALRDLDGTDFDKRKDAEAVLARLAEAEPFLSRYCETPAGKMNVAARRALESLHDARTRRNAKRFPDWAKAGRYDFMVDAGIHLTDEGQADALGNLLLAFGRDIYPIPEKLGGPKCRHPHARDLKQFITTAGQRLHKPGGVVATKEVASVYVRAQGLEAASRVRFNYLVLTRDRLAGPGDGVQWENCCLFHNGDVTLDGLDYSLLVCDGDITFAGDSLWGNGAVIIARGSIRSEKLLMFEGSTFYAGGDIAAEKAGAMEGLLLAGGKVDLPAPRRADGGKARVVMKGGVKECPFPVRFFETSDVGVEAALQDGALQITKLTPGSPLTKFGIKEGDIVTRVNEKDIKTANDFRRELRYSVALEAGIFHITRGDQKTTRVVYFHNGLEK